MVMTQGRQAGRGSIALAGRLEERLAGSFTVVLGRGRPG